MNPPKHIVVDARESGTSTGRYIDKLIENLHQLQPEYKFTILTKPERLEYIKRIAPNFAVEETDIKEFTFAEQTKMLKVLRRLKPDLVHFGMVQQPILYRGKVVTTMHDLTTIRFNNPSKNTIVFTTKQLVYKWLNKLVANKSEHIITPSMYVKNDVAQYTRVTPDKITVTYEAADVINDTAEPVRELANSQYIMYVGRPQPHKNLKRLIDAFALLQSAHPDLQLALVGRKDDLYSKLEQNTNKKGIKNVRFLGYVSDGQLRWLYEHTAAYVFPSLSEGFGLPGLEAMVHGAPVVSSDLTCLPEIYGDAAAYFNPKDTAAIAAAIDEVISNEAKRQSLLAQGMLRVNKYSWRTTALLTFDIYKSILLK